MLVVHTAAERPDLWVRGVLSSEVWPEYNTHGDVANRYWGRLASELPEFQFVLHDDEGDEVVAEAHSAPFAWDGDVANLGSYDATLELVFSQRAAGLVPDTLTALAAEVPRGSTRRGLAVHLLEGMRAIGVEHGLRRFVAPLRPLEKHRYPLTPMKEYVRWRRDDGSAFDAWIRLHERLGARISTPVTESFGITGTVAEWESWTGMAFPATGDYVFPEGLATVHIDRDAGVGSYWEPSVWMVHPDLG